MEIKCTNFARHQKGTQNIQDNRGVHRNNNRQSRKHY